MISIYLIPTFLAPETRNDVLPEGLVEKVKELNVFFVEDIKTARRFISSLKIGKVIDDITFYELTKKSKFDETFELMMNFSEDVGVLSEAGCPGIADPGALAVTIAHQLNYNVRPLVGPSSILLALMASGFNGQQFTFNGYLPIDRKDRVKRIKELERISHTTQSTQLFMETPFRNNQLFESILEHCHPNTKLTVSVNLTAPDAYSKTFSISKWREMKNLDFHKKPAIFGFGS